MTYPHITCTSINIIIPIPVGPASIQSPRDENITIISFKNIVAFDHHHLLYGCKHGHGAGSLLDSISLFA